MKKPENYKCVTKSLFRKSFSTYVEVEPLVHEGSLFGAGGVELTRLVLAHQIGQGCAAF
jgi:hypothetical protein